MLDSAGGLSRTAWALAPPKPKELTPAKTRPVGSGSRSRGTRSFSFSNSMVGFGVTRCRCGGIILCRSISATLIKPAMPAPASRCPMFVLTEPIMHWLPLARSQHKTALNACASMGSPTGVPVP